MERRRGRVGKQTKEVKRVSDWKPLKLYVRNQRPREKWVKELKKEMKTASVKSDDIV